MKFFKPIDVLFFNYLLISTIFLLLSWNSINQAWLLIGLRVIMSLLIVWLCYIHHSGSHSLVKLFRGAYPILLSGYFYSETFFYNKLLFNNIDPILIKSDAYIFGFQPSVEFSSAFSSLLWSELMYFSYFCFYLIIMTFVLYVFFKRRAYFAEAVFKLSFALYFFYLFFSFIPSAGPQFYFNAPENRLPDAYFFNHVMHFIQETAEQPTGAFPSSHVGISVIIVWLSYRKALSLFKLFGPVVLLLILSTVYIKAHYVVDIIGGLFIAPFILYLSNILYRFPAQTDSSTGK